MRITSKDQRTIPQEIVKESKPECASLGQTIVQRLRGTATVRMTTDEILSLTRKS
jgi:hypothetical protein